MYQPTLKKAISDLITLPQNATILDIGCRNAHWLLYFESLFGDKILKSTGVDQTSRSFDEVDYIGSKIELIESDCSSAIDFPDNSFDFVFTKDSLECITDKENHVKEIYRILKPNGFVICIHCDWDSIVFNGKEKELINKTIHNYANWKQPWMDDIDSWIGRRLYSIFNTTGLFTGQAYIHSVIETSYLEGNNGYNQIKNFGDLVTDNTGLITQEEYDLLVTDMQNAQENGTYLFSKPYYIYKGIKTV